jgi:hypothetical protein
MMKNKYRTKKDFLICFRCGKKYAKPSTSRYLCPECLKLPNDKNEVLWYCTFKHYLKAYNEPIRCSCCQETLSVLTPISIMGQKSRHFYHVECFNKFDTDPIKETIEYILISPNGKKVNTFEVV